MSKKRCYDETYVAFGFTTITEKDGTEKPQCFLCGAVYCNDRMRPAKLRHHLETKHPGNVNDNLDTFKLKRARFQATGTLKNVGFAQPKKPLLEASYKVAYLIAKKRKPHTIGETLIKPCALEMVELILGKKERKQVEEIPLSNNVICSRIADLSNDILDQVMSELKSSPFNFGMQLDETTDVSMCCQLLVYVRYVCNFKIKEEFLFCQPLQTTSKAADVFQMIATFFERNEFSWLTKLHSVCTDGAPSMLGNKSGLAALIKVNSPQTLVTHCMLHRHALAVKTLPAKLQSVMSTAIKIVNFIRSRAVNHRLFKVLCQELGSEYDVLLYYTEVRWLSKGKVFSRLMDLKDEVSSFLQEKEKTLAGDFEKTDFIVNMAYLADLFTLLNEFNLCLQGPEMTIIDANEKLVGFLNKLSLYKRRVEAENLANFPYLADVISSSGNKSMPVEIKKEIIQHITTLQLSFERYFDTKNLENNLWIRNPFIIGLDSVADEEEIKEDLIDLRSKELVKAEFNSKGLAEFWCSLKEIYPNLF